MNQILIEILGIYDSAFVLSVMGAKERPNKLIRDYGRATKVSLRGLLHRYGAIRLG